MRTGHRTTLALVAISVLAVWSAAGPAAAAIPTSTPAAARGGDRETCSATLPMTYPANGHTYLATACLSWQDAEALAVGLGGHLISLSDAAEEGWVRERFGALEWFWIGFNDIETEGAWVWSSGEPVTYTNWHDGEPNDFEGEDVAVMNWDSVIPGEPTFGNYWNDVDPTCCNRGIIEVAGPLPDPLVVTNTQDGGLGSLRAAIEHANRDSGPDVIVFNIPTTDPGFNGKWFTIRPSSPLPWLTDGGTTIDGSTQLSLTGNTNPYGPEIVVDGGEGGPVAAEPLVAAAAVGLPAAPPGACVGDTGFGLASDGNRIHALVLNGLGDAIEIRGSDNTVTGSYVGIGPTGSDRVPNCQGIGILSGTRNIIGGSSPADRNVISGNVWQGVSIHSSRNVVRGNYIGTDRTGTQAVGNGLEGVFIWPCTQPECGGPAQENSVGGPNAGDGNVISGNRNNGVWLEDSDNLVQGNFIGTDVTGADALGNQHDGVRVLASDNTIGGSAAGERNVISGNGAAGVEVLRGSGSAINGNYIGTDATGTRAVPNEVGVLLGGGDAMVTANEIGNGHLAPEPANVISGNRGAGIVLAGHAPGNYVIGNSVITNGGSGLELRSARNEIRGNQMSGNSGSGILFGSGANDNVLTGNNIGSSGCASMPNLGDGIAIVGSARNNVIGAAGGRHPWLDFCGVPPGGEVRAASVPAAIYPPGNLIAFNGGAGIAIVSSGDATPSGDRITGNNAIFSNGGLGIDLRPSSLEAGVTENDRGDADTGPNGLQNFPVLIRAQVTPGVLLVVGRIDTPTPETVRIELFANGVPAPNGDPSGHGEGTRFLGSATPNPGGTFTATLPSIAAGTLITATATDAAGNTSEFAANIAAHAPGPP